MENRHDMKQIKEQLTAIRDNSQRSLENMEAINLIMVDDNNSKLKDAKLGEQIQKLSQKLEEMSDVILHTEELLRDK
jgi:transcriptional/translational regulatory protein YebC/TACO1